MRQILPDPARRRELHTGQAAVMLVETVGVSKSRVKGCTIETILDADIRTENKTSLQDAPGDSGS